MSYFVVEFLDSKEVAVISHAWYLSENEAAWPLVKGPAFHRLLTNHKLPESSKYVSLQIRLLKITTTLTEALAYERRAQYESTFRSTDATDAAMPEYKQRKKRLVVLSSDSESDGENVASVSKAKLFSYSPLKQSNVVNSTMLNASTSALGISPPVLASYSKENIPDLGKASVDSTLLAELRLIRSSLDVNTEELKNLRQDIDNIQSCLKSNTEKLLIIEPLMRNAHKFIITTPPVLPKESTEECSNFQNSLFPLRFKEELTTLLEKMEQPDFYAQVVGTLSRIPRACSMSECVGSICSFAFSPGFARQVNWTGCNGKMRLMTSKLHLAIVDAVSSPHNFPNDSRGKIEYRIMRWFQYRRPRNNEDQVPKTSAETATRSLESTDDVDMDLSEDVIP